MPSIFELNEILIHKDILPGIQKTEFYLSSTLARHIEDSGKINRNVVLKGTKVLDDGWLVLAWTIDMRFTRVGYNVFFAENSFINNTPRYFIPVRSF